MSTEHGTPLLIVDDDPVFSRVLARALTRRGYHVATASSADEALEVALSHQPTLATIDLKMEGRSGLTLIPELKAMLPELNMLVLTGYASISTAVEAIKLGATNYLPKPADADQVLAALHQSSPDAETPVTETPMSVNRLEWEHIQKVLGEHDGNVSATARALGMHRRTLQRKLAKRPVRQ